MKTLLILLVLLFSVPMYGEAALFKKNIHKSRVTCKNKVRKPKHKYSIRYNLRQPRINAGLSFATTYDRTRNRKGLTR